MNKHIGSTFLLSAMLLLPLFFSCNSDDKRLHQMAILCEKDAFWFISGNEQPHSWITSPAALPGFRFYPNGKVEVGEFMVYPESNDYFGLVSEYNIWNDTLYIFSQDTLFFYKRHISLMNDSVIEFSPSQSYSDKKYHKHKSPALQSQEFDAVSLLIDGGMAPIDVQDAYLKASGELYIRKNGDIFRTHLDSAECASVFEDFRRTDFSTLPPKYDAQMMDAGTIFVSFLKDGSPVQELEDSGGLSPVLFRWACARLRGAFYGKELQKVSSPFQFPSEEVARRSFRTARGF